MPPIEYEDASPAVRAVIDDIKATRNVPDVNNFWKYLAHDPATLKWKDLVTPGTPLPTPWLKEAFEAHSRAIQQRRRAIRAANRPEAEMDALFREQQAEETRMLGAGPHAHAVGAFEGANYEAKGYYRPQVDCVMFTRNEVPFCAVCRRALENVIDLYAR